MPSKARILIVEDEAIVAMDLEARLGKLGYEAVGTAASGAEAIRKADELRPDLALMDIRIRGDMDGIAAADEIRRRFGIPVVYVTAYSDPATLERAKVTEAFGYILKPVEDRDVHTAVEIALYKHQVERKLRQMERWMASTLKSIGDGVIATDLLGRIAFINPVGETLTGWARGEAIGRPFTEVFRLVSDSALPPSENIVAKVLREGVLMELAPGSRLVTRIGIQIPVEDSAAPLRDDLGTITGVVVVFRDATRPHRIEGELAKSKEMLRQAAKMETIGQLAGGVAHDFNNLLTIILGYTDTLRTRNQTPENADALDAVHQAARRAADLTRQLLVFSRKSLLSPRSLDLDALIRELRPMLRRLLPEDVDLEIEPGGIQDGLIADPLQIEQAVINLAVNARDAMPKGGRLTIRTARIRTSSADAPAGWIEIGVTDSGSGMDESTRRRVFEPYFTTKPAGKGTGLGLTIVLDCVRSCNGRAEVDSQPGLGSTFRLLFPAARPGKAPLVPAPLPVALVGGRERILLVEDDEAVRLLIKRILIDLGYQVSDASRAEEARAHCASAEPDLVLTDLVMPGTSGPELATEFMTRHPKIKALYMSGYGRDALARYGLLDPSAPCLEKPFSAQALASAVRGVLEAKT